MNKKLLITLIILLALIIIIFISVKLFKTECGFWGTAINYKTDCDCIGIKTGGCPLFAMCSGGTYFCTGIKTKCYKIYPNNTKEVIPCK